MSSSKVEEIKPLGQEGTPPEDKGLQNNPPKPLDTLSVPPAEEPEDTFCPCCKLHTEALFSSIVAIISNVICTVMGAVYLAPYGKANKIVGGYYIAQGFFGLIWSFLLVYAVMHKRSKLVITAFIGLVVTLVLNLIGEVLNTIILEGSQDTTKKKKTRSTSTSTSTSSTTTPKPDVEKNIYAYLDLVAIIFITVIDIYVLFVIHAYLKQLRRTGQQVVNAKGPPGAEGDAQGSNSNSNPFSSMNNSSVSSVMTSTHDLDSVASSRSGSMITNKGSIAQ